VIGATYLVLRDGKATKYIAVPLSTSLKGWKSKWFYTENVKNGLSIDIDTPPKLHPNWTDKPIGDEMMQVEELLILLDQVNINGIE
jgi:hypothetical protein